MNILCSEQVRASHMASFAFEIYPSRAPHQHKGLSSKRLLNRETPTHLRRCMHGSGYVGGTSLLQDTNRVHSRQEQITCSLRIGASHLSPKAPSVLTTDENTRYEQLRGCEDDVVQELLEWSRSLGHTVPSNDLAHTFLRSHGC